MEIYKSFTFEAAHFLPNVPDGHKCKNLHGHSYKLTVYVSGEVSQDMGWVMDFADISSVVKPLLKQLDHSCLNDIEGLDNPTSENLALWFRKNLMALQGMSKIEISETEKSCCILEIK